MNKYKRIVIIVVVIILASIIGIIGINFYVQLSTKKQILSENKYLFIILYWGFLTRESWGFYI